MIKVFHGSDHIIKEPCYLGGKSDNDYGNGFYTTEYEDRARSWAVLNGNPLYLNKTPKQILESLGVAVREDAGISEAYDEFILEWMADVYTLMQWKDERFSDEIAGKIRPEELYANYYPLHEAAIFNGIEKLKKIYHLS